MNKFRDTILFKTENIISSVILYYKALFIDFYGKVWYSI